MIAQARLDQSRLKILHLETGNGTAGPAQEHVMRTGRICSQLKVISLPSLHKYNKRSLVLIPLSPSPFPTLP